MKIMHHTLFLLLTPVAAFAREGGMYRYPRNPMYLGLLLLIIAATIWLGTWVEIIIALFFILLINILQIIPEEESLLQIFGEEYLEYRKKEKRWI